MKKISTHHSKIYLIQYSYKYGDILSLNIPNISPIRSSQYYPRKYLEQNLSFTLKHLKILYLYKASNLKYIIRSMILSLQNSQKSMDKKLIFVQIITKNLNLNRMLQKSLSNQVLMQQNPIIIKKIHNLMKFIDFCYKRLKSQTLYPLLKLIKPKLKTISTIKLFSVIKKSLKLEN